MKTYTRNGIMRITLISLTLSAVLFAETDVCRIESKVINLEQITQMCIGGYKYVGKFNAGITQMQELNSDKDGGRPIRCSCKDKVVKKRRWF